MKLKFLLVGIISSLLSFQFIAEEEVEEVVVTGSYIKSSPTDGASPVEIVDRSEIDDLGATSIADITNNIAVNSGSENRSDSFTQGGTQGTSNINLRGLGLSSTLVLVDGRRHTVAGATANDGSVFVNTSMIPVVALDRVEILKEGAASVYGSDAVAGVVNYIFRRDFEGFEMEVSRQEADIGNQTDDRYSLIWGSGDDSTSVVVAASVLDRSAMAGSEFNPGLARNGISGLGNSFLLLAGPTTVASGPYAGDYTAYQNVPDANCVANNGILIPQASGSRCGFYYGSRFNVVNDEDHESVYLSVKTALDNGMDFDMDYMHTSVDVNDNPQSPSYPALSYLSPSNMVLPGTGGSPFAVPVLWLGRALGSAFPSPHAPRDIDGDRISLGLSGEMSNGFNWDVHYTVSGEKEYFKQPDTSTSRFAAAIAGNGGNSGDQTWSLFDPSANSQDLIDWISTAQETWTDVELSVLDVLLTGNVGEFDIAAGMQMKEEEYSVERSANSITVFDAAGNLVVPADLIFLGGGLVSDGNRESTAVFVEASTQVSDRLELKGAVRYEDLESDSTVDPKISMRYEVSDDLILRASYSSSFREASLAQLTSSGVGLQGIQDFDTSGNPVGAVTFIRIAGMNNPNLKPEESDNINIGAIWRPNDNFEMKVDYWAIDYTNLITIESAQGKVAANPTGADVKRTVDGTLVGVTTYYFNAAAVDANGLDIEATWDFDTALGQMQIGANVAHMMQYEIPNAAGVTQDVVGLFNHDNFARSLPETKAIIHGALVNGPHSLVGFGRWVSSYETTRALTSSAIAGGFSQDIDSMFTLDLKYSYTFDLGDNQMQLSAGINNVMDEEVPTVWDAANWSYDSKHHDPRGRMVYMGFKLSR